MPSMTYICKACGELVEYPASQNQDEQPIVEFDQEDTGVTIKIFPTLWELDEQGRPVQVVADRYTKITHTCGDVPRAPGVNFNLPASKN